MKTISIGAIVALILVLSGCSKGDSNYILTDYGKEPNTKVAEMKTVDPESDFFSFRFNSTIWDIQEWEADAAPNRVALVHQEYENNKCAILPGTLGQGLEKGNSVSQGTLLTPNYKGQTLDVYNSIGVQIMHIVGYEVAGMPYVFEVRLPAKDPEQCLTDAQAVISTFDVRIDEQEAPEQPESLESPEEADGSVSSTVTIQSSEE